MKRAPRSVLTLVFCLAFAGSLLAQAGASAKPPIYTYVSQWNIPRAQWADMEKVAAQDKTLLDKLVADGTLVNYGFFTSILHQENDSTHGSWFSATSEGNILKALEAIYAQPGLVTAPVQGSGRHWDMFLTGDVYNGKSGTFKNGYLSVAHWQLKPGGMRSFAAVTKQVFVPVLEKLVADGTVLSYGEMTEDYHTQGMGSVFEYFSVPDAASMDKVNKAFEDALAANPTVGDVIMNQTDPQKHADFLYHISSMTSK